MGGEELTRASRGRGELPFERAFRRWAEGEGVRWEETRIMRSEAGGESAAYRLSPRSAPRGVVLLVHGAGNDALFAMVGLSKRLLRSGLEVFTFDLDGHGRGGRTRLAGATISGAIPAAAAAALAGRRGVPLHTLGVSLGGSLLLHALPHLPVKPASAALVCAPLEIRTGWRAIGGELRPRLVRTLWREREDYGISGLLPSFGGWKRDVYPLRLAAEPPAGSFGYVVELNRILRSLSLESAARTVDLPVLLIYGSADRLVPAEQGERLASLLPHARLLVLPGETHLSAPMAPKALSALVAWVSGLEERA